MSELKPEVAFTTERSSFKVTTKHSVCLSFPIIAAPLPGPITLTAEARLSACMLFGATIVTLDGVLSGIPVRGSTMWEYLRPSISTA